MSTDKISIDETDDEVVIRVEKRGVGSAVGRALMNHAQELARESDDKV